jgi:hypothetical protein
METYVLVAKSIQNVIDGKESYTIAKIFRSYESRTRAEEDMELLAQSNIAPGILDIICVPHIDR